MYLFSLNHIAFIIKLKSHLVTTFLQLINWISIFTYNACVPPWVILYRSITCYLFAPVMSLAAQKNTLLHISKVLWELSIGTTTWKKDFYRKGGIWDGSWKMNRISGGDMTGEGWAARSPVSDVWSIGRERREKLLWFLMKWGSSSPLDAAGGGS